MRLLDLEIHLRIDVPLHLFTVAELLAGARASVLRVLAVPGIGLCCNYTDAKQISKTVELWYIVLWQQQRRTANLLDNLLEAKYLQFTYTTFMVN